MDRPFTPHNRWTAALAASLSVLLVGCGIGIQRDLSTMKPPEVVYDDACGLQEYFDALKSPQVAPPSETFSQDFSQGGASKDVGGKTRFLFSSDFQLHYLKRTLTQNWSRLPPELVSAPAVEIEVRWAEKAGVKRVVTTDDARVMAGSKSWYLPYHVCLSDMLFGEELYDTRRVFLQLPPPRPNRFINGNDAGIVTPALARADVVGTHEINDGATDNTDAARPPAVAKPAQTAAETPAVVVKPGRGPLRQPKVGVDKPGSAAPAAGQQKLAAPESRTDSAKRAVPASQDE